MRSITFLDELMGVAQSALTAVAGMPASSRPYPPGADTLEASQLSPAQRAEAAALMRVNHVGEICAQALYEAQALTARSDELRGTFRKAAIEEADHLNWTRRRIDELGGRTSLLAPAWYAGAFAIGLVAGRFGDRDSLGFMAETERQVEQHLDGHLERLPAEDQASRAVVEQMKADEVRHAQTADALGGAELPAPVRGAMRIAAKVMTTVAHYV